jgi:hypothetical protein
VIECKFRIEHLLGASFVLLVRGLSVQHLSVSPKMPPGRYRCQIVLTAIATATERIRFADLFGGFFEFQIFEGSLAFRWDLLFSGGLFRCGV